MLTDFFQTFCTTESVWNLLQNSYDVTHLTLGMLLHYLGKFSADVEENAKKCIFNRL